MFKESLNELKDRFLSKRPVTDPDREQDRIDRDRTREVFARAESFARMGPPIDASLEPVSSPENVQLRLTSGKRDVHRESARSGGIAARGNSRGVEAGRNALVSEAGWGYEEAEALKLEVTQGEMTEGQFMRVVESELERSQTSGRVVDPPTPPGPEGVDRRGGSGRFVSDNREDAGIGRGDNGQFEAVEDLVHDRRR